MCHTHLTSLAFARSHNKRWNLWGQPLKTNSLPFNANSSANECMNSLSSIHIPHVSKINNVDHCKWVRGHRTATHTHTHTLFRPLFFDPNKYNYLGYCCTGAPAWFYWANNCFYSLLFFFCILNGTQSTHVSSDEVCAGTVEKGTTRENIQHRIK